MFRLLRRLVILVLAAIALFALVPPGARALPGPPAGVTPGVRGALHMHTVRSDGTGSIDDVTAAAARAGLRFVIVTDHGDATREPDLPDYRNGVLYIDAVEISTSNGHVVALGLPKAPYPLRGDARDVLEDIARLGGFAIAAHPGSPKPELRWTEWDVPFGGLEWLNADSEWRDEPPWTLARALLAYPFRHAQALALLLDRPEPVMRRWDALTQQRRVVAVAAADAHSRVGVRTVGEPYDASGSGSVHFPSYESVLREFSITLPDVQLTGAAEVDAPNVLGAIRAGHVYSTIDALAGPAALRFTATSGSRTASMGDALPLEGPVMLRVDAQAPQDARISLLRNGVPIAGADGPLLEHAVPADTAVYRVEVALPGAPGTPPVPWLVSNPIYAGRSSGEGTAQAPAPPREFAVLYDGGPARGWTVEKSPASDAAIDVVGTVGGTQLLLRFALSGTPSDNPYVAFVMPATAALVAHDRLVFTARADRPMRMSVQLRAPTGGDGDRWFRSVYLDQTPRTIQLRFDDFRPVGSTASPTPVPASVQSVLLVVDTVNTKIGSNGQIWIDDIKYAR